jgi:hypothetical protein
MSLLYPKMTQRPSDFRLNAASPLYGSLVFAGLGQQPGTTRYRDASGWANDGTLTNMDPPTDWVWDKTLNRFVLDFDGANDYSTRAPGVVSTEPLSIVAWAKPTNFAPSVQTIAAIGNNGSSGFWRLYLEQTTGQTVAQKQTDAGNPHSATAGNATVNAWSHCSAIFLSTTARYAALNGVVWSLDTYNITDPTASFTSVGALRRSSVIHYMLGQLTDVLIVKSDWRPYLSALADPTNVDLRVGNVPLILPPARRWWSAAAGPVFKPAWAVQRRRSLQGV